MREKTALVTGAARGIGAAISDRFRKLGARVLDPSRNDLDLSSDVSVDGFLSRLGEPIDILVNNAGINIPAGLSDITKEAMDDTLRTNLIGPIHLIRGVVPGMKERRYGRILNISSIWSLVSRDRRLAYGVSKSALNGLTRNLAVELAPFEILVNAIAPGFLDTEMTRRNISEQELEEIRKRIPLLRLGTPEEIAWIAGFLCSRQNGYITGQVIVADGGYTCL